MKLYSVNMRAMARRRLLLGLTRTEVAELLHVAVGTIANYEEGRTVIPMNRYLLLCTLYDVEPLDFIETVSKV